MKKLFLLIPALVLAILANAVTPGTQALRSAYNDAEAGSTLVLEAGTYEETERIEFTKSMTIMAAEGAEVIVKTYKDNPLTLGAEVKFIGIQFDGSAMGTREYFIRSYDATAGNELHFENCEVYNFPSATYLINAASDARSLDSIIINNCYFHNNGNDAIYVSGAAASKGIIITNSTFANSSASHSIIEVRNGSSDPTEDIELIVDHCTFYNNTYGDGDYTNIRAAKLVKSYISNCIFAHSEAYAKYAAYSYGGTISNCLTYNLTSGYRDWSPCAVFSNNITADPLFNDLANNKYTFDGNWTTMSISPARGAATDGSDLGAPRWYSAEVLPNVDFATPYQFIGAKALLAGKIWYDDVNEYLYGDGGSNKDYGTATWKFHATKGGVFSIAANINSANTSTHKLRVEVLDADGNSVGEFAEQTSTLPGTLVLPAVGDYKIILHDDQTWSSVKIDNVTISYIGGAVQAMPGTTNINEAWFSSNGTRDAGAISYTSVGSGCWAKWNISVANPAWYDVTANIKGQYGHQISVDFYEAGNNTPIATAAEETTVYGNDPTLYPAALGLVYLPAGNYEMQFSNSIGDAALISIALAYAGGNVTDIVDDANTTLNVSDAWFTASCVRADGKIEYHEDNANAWIKWNIAATATKLYDVTVNIEAPNGHEFAVKIYEDENEEPIASINEHFSEETGTLALALGRVSLVENKNYVVKVTNTPSGSKAKVLNLVFAPVVATATALPNTLAFSDAVLSEKANITDGMLYFNEPGEDKDPRGQWAQWEVTTDHNGKFLFTLNATSTNGQKYKITIYDNLNNEVDSYEENFDSGDKTMKHFFVLATGNYFVKVENTRSYSKGHLTSLVVTEPTVITLDETATDISAIIEANFNTGAKHYQLIRTLKAGMYNTFCSPLKLTSDVCEAVFGEDVEIYTLEEAVADGAVLNVELKSSSSVWQGTPVFIRPSHDIVNPIFIDVEMLAQTPASTTKTNADFVGTFVKTTLSHEENILYLGPDNTLYYPEVDTPIKGMRGWFLIHDTSTPAPAIKRMNIVNAPAVVTEINLIDADNKAVKTIENGQLVITIDGVRYNVMGVKIQ